MIGTPHQICCSANWMACAQMVVTSVRRTYAKRVLRLTQGPGG
jgi:hypothetical protein